MNSLWQILLAVALSFASIGDERISVRAQWAESPCELLSQREPENRSLARPDEISSFQLPLLKEDELEQAKASSETATPKPAVAAHYARKRLAEPAALEPFERAGLGCRSPPRAA